MRFTKEFKLECVRKHKAGSASTIREDTNAALSWTASADGPRFSMRWGNRLRAQKAEPG